MVVFSSIIKKKFGRKTKTLLFIRDVFYGIDADNARLCYRYNMNYVNIIDHFISEFRYDHLEIVSLCDKIHNFNPDVYVSYETG